MTAAIRCAGNLEEIVRISEADGAKLSALQQRLRAAVKGELSDTFEVNIVGVRTVTTKGRLRNRYHEEFIIRTRRPNQPEIYVSRRYGDFARLAETLRIDFTDEEIRPPPNKDRSHRHVDDDASAAQSQPQASISREPYVERVLGARARGAESVSDAMMEMEGVRFESSGDEDGRDEDVGEDVEVAIEVEGEEFEEEQEEEVGRLGGEAIPTPASMPGMLALPGLG
ncbi:hypothetical protein A4X06_0g9276 [Tilletia controversa]|uniref:PX domain-containing protein n=1 Tax=Tilletia controversa TaxID=13291 RepID=A0A8X7MJH4_9BASI|nr:hypothetical protein A4X06_0g9276 [Tilletia controversa]